MLPGVLQKFPALTGGIKEQLQDSGKILNNKFRGEQKQNK
jgi:hypothetical protein